MQARPLQTCSSVRADVTCAERYQAERDGEFGWSESLRGWYFMERGKPLGPAPFYRFLWCPWCLAALPGPQKKQSTYDPRWESGEEGG